MIFSALINNITLIISLSILYSFIIRRWKYRSRIGQAISGLLFGAVAVVGMMNPLTISQGLIFDGRSIIISIAGFIGGWVTALIAALMAIIYRSGLGGPGAIMGVSVITSSALIGIAYHYIRRRRPQVVTPLHLIGFGIIVHICMLAMTMTLPASMRYEVLSNIALPIMLIYPLGTLLVCVVLLDLELRIRAESGLHESEKKYRDLFDFLPIPVYEMDLEATITSANRAIYETFGGTEEDLKKGFNVSRILAPEEIDKSSKNMQILLEGGQIVGTEYNLMRLDGSTFPAIVISSVIYSNGKPVGLRGAIIDITGRRQAEESLLRMNKFLDSVVENIPNMIFLKDAGNLRFVRFNRAGEDLLGYSRNDLLGKSDYDFFPKEQADFFTMKDREVLQGKILVDIPEEPMQTRSKGERTVHTKKVPILDAKGEPEYLLGISEDITERRQAEKQLQDTLESLRKAVGTTIQIMVSTVEARDPYTAGHQMRSADLARAIATEMGLPSEKIEGIRMAGSIHDIGKISIPAEILSKPTKLSEIEFALIKEHSRRGYEMLKDVESPWPLAEIVHQHHERMDGSGYPRKLKGKEILIEARILSVADVVEAMASHRPYRPGLGIDAALNEIEKNKGIFYDNDVADACLRLFREKGFKLEDVRL